jgi:leader peptidase (prepilin peptidase)/N-methyltransferase
VFGGRLDVETLVRIVLLAALFAMAMIDYRKHTVMVYLAVCIAVIGVLLRIAFNEIEIYDTLAGASIGAALLIISYITGGKVGAGDGIVFVTTGIFLGFWQNMELLMVSLWMASLVALFLLIFGRKSRGAKIPFIPFVFTAYVVMLI